MSNSVRPHKRQPTRLSHPWDSPGKNTGVGCHFLLQSMKGKRESKAAQSCQTLSDPKDCSLPVSSVHFPGKSTGVGCHCLLPLNHTYLQIKTISRSYFHLPWYILYTIENMLTLSSERKQNPCVMFTSWQSNCFLPCENISLPTWKKAFTRSWPCWNRISDFQPPDLWENKFLFFKIPGLSMVFCYSISN